MFDLVGRQDGHDGSHADAVVGAERRSASFHPVAVDVHVDALAVEIEVRFGIFLVHHVQVPLHHDRHPVFHAGTGRFADDHIAGVVNDGFQPQSLAELLHERDHAPLFFRGTRDCVQLTEAGPHLARFEIENFLSHSAIFRWGLNSRTPYTSLYAAALIEIKY